MNRAARRKTLHENKVRATAYRHLRIDGLELESLKTLTPGTLAKFLRAVAYIAHKRGWCTKAEARMFGCRFVKSGR